MRDIFPPLMAGLLDKKVFLLSAGGLSYFQANPRNHLLNRLVWDGCCGFRSAALLLVLSTAPQEHDIYRTVEKGHPRRESVNITGWWFEPI